MVDWLRLKVIYDATVGLHSRSSATILEDFFMCGCSSGFTRQGRRRFALVLKSDR